LIAFAVRLFLRESAPWEASRARASRAPTPQQLFTPELRRATTTSAGKKILPDSPCSLDN